MRLSEAIRIGDQLRPACGELGERFIVIEGRGLCSDAWGAACEAVQPAVATFNWNPLDVYKFERSMDALRAVQQQYFREYFTFPAQCPGARRMIQGVGGRIFTQNRQPHLKTYDDYAKLIPVGGITTECAKVEHLAGMVDHLFYAHRWERRDIADVVEWYENTRSQAAITTHFAHHRISRIAQPTGGS